jgi:hypothetical protein
LPVFRGDMTVADGRGVLQFSADVPVAGVRFRPADPTRFNEAALCCIIVSRSSTVTVVFIALFCEIFGVCHDFTSVCLY